MAHAPAAQASTYGVDFVPTQWYYFDNYSTYEIGSAMEASGSAFVTACHKSAAKLSNGNNPKVYTYGYTPLGVDFYFLAHTLDNAYHNTLSWNPYVTPALAWTNHTMYQTFPCYNGSDYWYIRFDNSSGDYPFSTICPTAGTYWDFHGVCCHELGHAAGTGRSSAGSKPDTFLDPSAQADDVWAVRPERHLRRTISEHDVNGLIFMYGDY